MRVCVYGEALFCRISALTCYEAVKISEVMLFEWMSTEINNAVDRHLKHAPRLVSRSNIHSCMTEIRVGCKPPFTYWRAAAPHLSLFSLLLGTRPYTGFLSAYFLCILAFLQGFLSIESQFSCQLKWVFFIVASFFFNMLVCMCNFCLPLAGIQNLKPPKKV